MTRSDEKDNPTYQNSWDTQLVKDKSMFSRSILVNARSGKGIRARQNIKNVVREKAGMHRIDIDDKPVFYRQYMAGRFFSETVDEFCELANATDKSILRIQIDISPLLAVKEGHWYQIIRFCLFCWYLQSTPAVVFTSPVMNCHLDLFVLQDDRSLWKDLNEYQRTLFNRVVAMRIGHWLAKPLYMSYSIHKVMDYFSESSYQLFIDRAIYVAMNEYRVETFQAFQLCLQRHFSIDLKYNIHREYIVNLKFRYERLPWLRVDELSFSTSEINSWINFNRLFQHEFMGERVFTNGFLE
ncbi:hypothetical protein GCM10028805_51870 [Spirosoma harenae]